MPVRDSRNIQRLSFSAFSNTVISHTNVWRVFCESFLSVFLSLSLSLSLSLFPYSSLFLFPFFLFCLSFPHEELQADGAQEFPVASAFFWDLQNSLWMAERFLPRALVAQLHHHNLCMEITPSSLDVKPTSPELSNMVLGNHPSSPCPKQYWCRKGEELGQ